MPEPELHTDALERDHGPIHAVVLRHDAKPKAPAVSERIREAKLVDLKGTMRTYALTILADLKDDSALKAADQEIQEGGLIGKTFTKHGYATARNVIDAFSVTLSPWMQKEFRTTATEASANVVEFLVAKEGRASTLYGTILEIYSPDSKNGGRNGKTLSTGYLDSSAHEGLRKKMIGYLASIERDRI